MIILSKHKDYYDYLTGVYGRDENKIFDRREMVTSKEFPFDEKVKEFHTRGGQLKWRYHGYWYNCVHIIIHNKLYKFEQVEVGVWEHHKFLKKDNMFTMPVSLICCDKHAQEYEDFIISNDNFIYRQPISIYKLIDFDYNKGWIKEPINKVPLLSSFGFYNILSAEKIYTEIDMFLGWLKDNPQPVNKTTDLEKLESKGFDKKISFRHRKEDK